MQRRAWEFQGHGHACSGGRVGLKGPGAARSGCLPHRRHRSSRQHAALHLIVAKYAKATGLMDMAAGLQAAGKKTKGGKLDSSLVSLQWRANVVHSLPTRLQLSL